jgi:hypothetical protein
LSLVVVAVALPLQQLVMVAVVVLEGSVQALVYP